MATNKRHSGQDYTTKVLTDEPAEDFNHTDIVGSCFAKERPDTVVFPEGMVGVTFRGCNLDNVVVPPGNTIEPSCTHKRIRAFPPVVGDPEELSEDWECGEDDKPLRPIMKRRTVLQDGKKVELTRDPSQISAKSVEEV